MKKPTAPEQPPLFDSAGRKPQARWLAAAELRAAARRAFEELPDAEREAIWQRVDRLLFREAIWIRAKSPEYADNPHSYTRRRDFRRDEDFVFLVEFIRSGVCDREKYHGRWYDVLNRAHAVSGVVCKIWPMGWPINFSNGRPCTILLNRKPCLPEDR